MSKEFLTMKTFLSTTTLFEALTGIAMLVVPSLVVQILLDTTLTEQSGILLGRLSGEALIALAIACWMARDNSTISLFMIKAFVFYNSAAALLLVYAATV